MADYQGKYASFREEQRGNFERLWLVKSNETKRVMGRVVSRSHGADFIPEPFRIESRVMKLEILSFTEAMNGHFHNPPHTAEPMFVFQPKSRWLNLSITDKNLTDACKIMGIKRNDLVCSLMTEVNEISSRPNGKRKAFRLLLKYEPFFTLLC